MKNTVRGFSLVELLVAVAIMLILGTIVTSVLFISLRTSRKSETTLVVKQNGEVALSQITNAIRFASKLKDPVTCLAPITQSSVTVTSSFDDGQTTFSCTGTTIASNGASLIDTNVLLVNTCSFSCSQTTRTSPPTITLAFTLSAKTASSFVERTATVPFQTSITMRNFSR